jgi:hypothetical protein
MATYRLTLASGSTTYAPIFLIEETDGAGAVLEDSGLNLFMVGKFDCKYRPETLSMDITTVSGRSISLVYANIDTYDIFGNSTNGTTMYLLFDLICSRTISNL